MSRNLEGSGNRESNFQLVCRPQNSSWEGPLCNAVLFQWESASICPAWFGNLAGNIGQKISIIWL
jgi:hypothetical protein